MDINSRLHKLIQIRSFHSQPDINNTFYLKTMDRNSARMVKQGMTNTGALAGAQASLAAREARLALPLARVAGFDALALFDSIPEASC